MPCTHTGTGTGTSTSIPGAHPWHRPLGTFTYSEKETIPRKFRQTTVATGHGQGRRTIQGEDAHPTVFLLSAHTKTNT